MLWYFQNIFLTAFFSVIIRGNLVYLTTHQMPNIIVLEINSLCLPAIHIYYIHITKHNMYERQRKTCARSQICRHEIGSHFFCGRLWQSRISPTQCRSMGMATTHLILWYNKANYANYDWGMTYGNDITCHTFPGIKYIFEFYDRCLI